MIFDILVDPQSRHVHYLRQPVAMLGKKTPTQVDAGNHDKSDYTRHRSWCAANNQVIRKRLLSACLAATLAILIACSQAATAASFAEAEKHAKMTESLVEGRDWKDGTSLVNRVYGVAAKLDGYQFNSEMKAFVGHYKHSLARISFKKQKRIRIDVLSGTVHKGSTVVRRKDGKIKGLGGGYLRFLNMKLEPNSTILKTPTGHNVLNSDFGSLFRILEQRIKGNESVFVASGTVRLPGFHNPVRVLDIRKANLKTGRVFIDTVTNLPVEWDTYRKGKLICFVTFTKLNLKAGLNDKFFDL